MNKLVIAVLYRPSNSTKIFVAVASRCHPRLVFRFWRSIPLISIEVVELTDFTFDKTVLAPDAGVWFIRFYAPVIACYYLF